MFSQASSDPSLADKSVYKTLIRLGPPFNRLGQALVEIFGHFNWKRAVIVSRRKTDNKKVFCDYSSRAADVIFRANNITVAEWMIIDDGITDAKIDEMLERVYQRGRIVILCSENKDDTRRILLRGKEAGMMDGSFVFWMPDHLPPDNVEKPWLRGDSSDADAKLTFRNVFQITVAEMAGPEVESFRDLIPLKMAESPWFYNTSIENRKRGSEYSPFLHDVVYLYLLTLNETLAEGLDHRNGTAIVQKARNKTFRGVTGNVKLDLNGDREPDYWVWHLEPDAEKFAVVMEARMTSSTKKIYVTSDIKWSTFDGLVPVDVPICGFTGDLCIKKTSYIITIVVPVVMVISFVILLVPSVIVYRRIKFEREVEKMTWKIESHEIKLSEARCFGSIGQVIHYLQ
ncbi:atrial natriuretic peptide receptor 1-like [Patella vulgata]|uniref:atrial natriuretic peptide receptor 1-like n=1 Tax=Patella vulgata TaxID=6465 RepID=UPI0024A85F51|nr:atrial natriuretic peptide receptor 1-like [Patella vulgata]